MYINVQLCKVTHIESEITHCQEEPNQRGVGVLGIVQADFLTPTHDKQNFNDTRVSRSMLTST